jgi:hypothetical protein
MSTNPYQPPSSFQPPYSTQVAQRPAAATVFGILNILFGALGICSIPLTGMMLFAPMDKQMTDQNPALKLMAENAGYKLFMMAGLGLGMIAVVVLIIAGIGLWQLKPYGRTLSIGYGIYGVAANVVGLLVNSMLLFPVLLDKVNAAPPGPQQAGAYGGLIGGIAGGCMGFVYPVLILIFMFRPNMVAAFKANK